jgi:hypothetical protein
MTFTHTLSRRLALLRNAATVAALVVVASCDLFSPVDTGLEVAQLLVTPGSATLPTSGTQGFVAYAHLKDGDSVAVTVAWSATGGSISSAGVYTAGLTTGEYAVAATMKGFTDTATVTLTSIPVASVSVSPASATLSVGATQQLSAVTKDSAGNTLTGRVVTWSSSNPAIATVSGSGLVTAIAAGSATITATSEGKTGTSAITVQAPGSHAGYYVAPTGSPTGDGSAAKPWNLAHALSHPAAVLPGDTIWLRGGTYSLTSELTPVLLGTALNPIIVRQYPGERATIDVRDTRLFISGGHTWYWGFEVMSSTPNGNDLSAFDIRSPSVKAINLVVHDSQGTGISSFTAGTNTEINGCLLYNNGRQIQIPGKAHAIYSHNVTGTKLIKDNIIFHSQGFDLHLYSQGSSVNDFTLDGNIGINTGSVGGWWLLQGYPSNNIVFQNNRLYGVNGTIDLAPTDYAAGPISILNNYVWLASVHWGHYDLLTATGNTLALRSYWLFLPPGGYPVAPNYVIDNNSYFGIPGDPQFYSWIAGVADLQGTDFAGWKAATPYDDNSTLTQNANGKPTVNHVFVRPNQYEAGRANIAIFNWQLLGSVAVDLSTVLNPGDRYEVRNVMDYFGTPVLSGTYAGGSVSIPMTAVTPPVPVGGWPGAAPPVTGPEFNAFVVLRTSP